MSESRGIWEGVEVHENGTISESDARRVRKRLRILIIADMQNLSLVLSEAEKLQDKLANLATMEFAVEDLTYREIKAAFDVLVGKEDQDVHT